MYKALIVVLFAGLVVALSSVLPSKPMDGFVPFNERNVEQKGSIAIDSKEPLGFIAKIPIYPKPFEEVMTQIGVPQNEWPGLLYIFGQESGFCALKWEGQRTCPTEYVQLHDPDSHVGYGWCQATPASKYAEQGSDWKTNVLTQARWCYKYAKSYGSIDQAVSFKQCLGSCWSSRTHSKTYKKTPWF